MGTELFCSSESEAQATNMKLLAMLSSIRHVRCQLIFFIPLKLTYKLGHTGGDRLSFSFSPTFQFLEQSSDSGK